MGRISNESFNKGQNQLKVCFFRAVLLEVVTTYIFITRWNIKIRRDVLSLPQILVTVVAVLGL